jgi:hypothetical protein
MLARLLGLRDGVRPTKEMHPLEGKWPRLCSSLSRLRSSEHSTAKAGLLKAKWTNGVHPCMVVGKGDKDEATSEDSSMDVGLMRAQGHDLAVPFR